ncbi:MAG: hypothetical protein CM1200mP1_10640 [Candidatus Neomarinimicrobiota bacterium]|nr:MAG: hypothetical protein CM1200mP1_10640 [Candidatus Neomarinimicrobiota bacterium]
MLISLSRPKSLPGRLLNVILIAYLIVGVSGCSNPPRTEKPQHLLLEQWKLVHLMVT